MLAHYRRTFPLHNKRNTVHCQQSVSPIAAVAVPPCKPSSPPTVSPRSTPRYRNTERFRYTACQLTNALPATMAEPPALTHCVPSHSFKVDVDVSYQNCPVNGVDGAVPLTVAVMVPMPVGPVGPVGPVEPIVPVIPVGPAPPAPVGPVAPVF